MTQTTHNWLRCDIVYCKVIIIAVCDINYKIINKLYLYRHFILVRQYLFFFLTKISHCRIDRQLLLN